MPVKSSPKNAAPISPSSRQRKPIETRAQMLERLTNPPISLHEAAVLLGVCTATVRHYSDDGTLPHQRTGGGQRRFALRDVLDLVREREARRRRRNGNHRLQTSPLTMPSRAANAPRPPAPSPSALPARPIGPRAADENPRAAALLLRAGLRNARRS